MKKIVITLFLAAIGLVANAQIASKEKATPQSVVLKAKTVEIACGECKFKMKGKGCDLAIRVDGKSYFVDGKSVDDFGDAHDEKHGFCNVIGKAKVTGSIVGDRFKAETIDLIETKK
jgi:hypothetical protein